MKVGVLGIKIDTNFIGKGKEVVSSITSRVSKVAQSVIESIKHLYKHTMMTLRGEIVKIAAFSNCTPVIKHILQLGPISQKARDTAFIAASKNQSISSLKALVANGAVVSDDAMWEAGIQALINGNVPVLKFLLED